MHNGGGEVVYAFGELVRGFRERAGLSQRELGQMVGRDRNTISNWERSRFLPETRDLTLKIAEELQLSPQETNQLLRSADFPVEYETASPQRAGSSLKEAERTYNAQTADVFGYLHLRPGATSEKWYELRGERVIIGRHKRKCDVIIPIEYEHVSRVHASIYQARHDVYIEDSSTFGTFVDGIRIKGATRLRPGQHLLLGGNSPGPGVCVLEFSREPYSTR